MFVFMLLFPRQSDAQQLEMVKMMRMTGIGAPTKEDRLKEAARIHIRLGNVQRYCELMVDMGEVCINTQYYSHIQLHTFQDCVTLKLLLPINNKFFCY
jgi:hypothetical protein